MLAWWGVSGRCEFSSWGGIKRFALFALRNKLVPLLLELI